MQKIQWKSLFSQFLPSFQQVAGIRGKLQIFMVSFRMLGSRITKDFHFFDKRLLVIFSVRLWMIWLVESFLVSNQRNETFLVEFTLKFAAGDSGHDYPRRFRGHLDYRQANPISKLFFFPRKTKYFREEICK